MHTTKVFSKLVNAYKDPQTRVIALRGGTRSGKTCAVVQFLNYIGERSKRKRTISVISESLPHLKKGAIKDFKDMLGDAYDDDRWHDSDKHYKYKHGTILEFFSAQNTGKVTGPARDILYINEAINIPWEIYRQAAIRTTEKIIIDWNPAFDFWYDEYLSQRADVQVIDSTYLDNDMLTAAQIAEIESNKEIDPDWWNVYGLGMKGSKEGLVVQNWEICAEMPTIFKKEYGAIDFGWSAPSALSHLRLSEGDTYIKQVAYAPGLDNPKIAKIIHDAGLARMEWVCDAAEPKSIDELRSMGVNAVASASKDIKLGIQIMNRYRKFITSDSVDIIREARQYRYAKDVNTGKYGDIPVDAHNHTWDGIRYIFLNKLSAIIPPSFSISTSKRRK